MVIAIRSFFQLILILNDEFFVFLYRTTDAVHTLMFVKSKDTGRVLQVLFPLRLNIVKTASNFQKLRFFSFSLQFKKKLFIWVLYLVRYAQRTRRQHPRSQNAMSPSQNRTVDLERKDWFQSKKQLSRNQLLKLI
jgi:hypothetical protein